MMPYEFVDNFNSITDNELVLSFLTSNSGTFVINEGEIIDVVRRKTIDFPSQVLGAGLGVRVEKESGLIHEFSLTKFSVVSSSFIERYEFSIDGDFRGSSVKGYNQTSGAFAMRYEIGKLFGDKRNNARFGLTGGIAPGYYFSNRTAVSSQDFPIKANIFSMEFSLSPSLSTKIGKKLFLDFKVTSNLFTVNMGAAPYEVNPTKFSGKSEGRLENDEPVITWSGAIQLRYLIKEPKKRRRKS